MTSMEAPCPGPAVTDKNPNRPLRIALVSTPRAGNNWLRHLLGGLYQLPTLPVPGPRQIDWTALPPECLLAIHWHPTAAFLDHLNRHGFRAIVLARHPLDVLVSILHFALHYASSAATQGWLEGEEGNERGIFAAMPRSTAFLDYARGGRAGALLSVSHEWWHLPSCLRVRYEDLLHHPENTLEQLAEGLAAPLRAAPAAVLAESSMAHLRHSTGSRYHFWQGQSGLWRRLLPSAEATSIANAHPAVFATLGYVVDPDPDLDGAQADANWIKLIWDELAEDLFALRQQRGERTGPTFQAQLAESRRAHGELVERFSAVQNQLLATQVTYQDMLEKFTLGQQAVGEMRARCTLAEDQAEDLRERNAALQTRVVQLEDTCEELHEQLLLAQQAREFREVEETAPRPTLLYEEAAPRGGRVACTLRRLGQRYPPLASLAKWVSGP